jgi:Putative MetA-pathway of phenol degradation
MNKLRKELHQYCAFLSLFILLLLFSSKSLAQELVTDRPDITESAVTVSTGDLQIEDGFLFESQSLNEKEFKAKIHNYTISSALFRIGLLNKLELRIGGDYLYQITETEDIKTKTSGFNNLMIGSKLQFMDEEFDGQDLGLLLQFYLPVGNESFRSKSVEPEILLAYGKDLSELFSLSANIGSHWNSNDENLILLYSASFDIDISSKWDSFFEFYGNASGSSKTNYSFDCGLCYRLIKNLQFDISAGNQSFSDLNDWFVGTGVSVRLPR